MHLVVYRESRSIPWRGGCSGSYWRTNSFNFPSRQAVWHPLNVSCSVRFVVYFLFWFPFSVLSSQTDANLMFHLVVTLSILQSLLVESAIKYLILYSFYQHSHWQSDWEETVRLLSEFEVAERYWSRLLFHGSSVEWFGSFSSKKTKEKLMCWFWL